MRTGYSKSEKMDPWVSKSEGKGTKSEPRDTKREKCCPFFGHWEPKVSQRGPKVSQRAPKVSQKVAKGSQREPKGSQKGAKSEPKGDQNASKNQPSEKVAKREPKWSYRLMLFGSVLESFSIKNR